MTAKIFAPPPQNRPVPGPLDAAQQSFFAAAARDAEQLQEILSYEGAPLEPVIRHAAHLQKYAGMFGYTLMGGMAERLASCARQTKLHHNHQRRVLSEMLRLLQLVIRQHGKADGDIDKKLDEILASITPT